MPESNLNKRLKKLLFEMMKYEKDAEAWNHFKTLELEWSDYNDAIMFTPFRDEAWEIFKHTDAPADYFSHIIHHVKNPTIRNEAEAILMERYGQNPEALDNKVLEEIIRYNHSDAAAAILLERNPTPDELSTIIEFSVQYCDRAAQKLLETKPDLDQLRVILEHSTLKKESWERIVALSPSLEDLSSIISFTEWDDTPWNYFLAQNPSNAAFRDLIFDFADTGRKQIEAAEYVLAHDPDVENLVDIIQNDLFEELAWKMLKAKHLTSEDMEYIAWKLMRRKHTTKNAAAQLCLNQNADVNVLWDIFRYTDVKDEAAAGLVEKAELDLYQWEEIISESAIEPVVNGLCAQIGFDRSGIDEKAILYEIAQKVLADPAILDVGLWNHPDRKCIGGWAISLSPAAQEIEKQYSSEIAACLLIPSYRHLIFADKETVLKRLEEIVAST